MGWSALHPVARLRVTCDFPLSLSPRRLQRWGKPQRESRLGGGGRKCSPGLARSERPVGRVSEDTELALARVERRDREWTPCVTGVAVMFAATGLGGTVDKGRREKGSAKGP